MVLSIVLHFVKGICLTLFKIIYCILLYFILNENIIKILVFLSAGDDQTHSEAFLYNKACTLQFLQ